MCRVFRIASVYIRVGYVQADVYVYMCLRECVYACVCSFYVHTCVCMRLCVHVFVDIYMHDCRVFVGTRTFIGVDYVSVEVFVFMFVYVCVWLNLQTSTKA